MHCIVFSVLVCGSTVLQLWAEHTYVCKFVFDSYHELHIAGVCMNEYM